MGWRGRCDHDHYRLKDSSEAPSLSNIQAFRFGKISLHQAVLPPACYGQVVGGETHVHTYTILAMSYAIQCNANRNLTR